MPNKNKSIISKILFSLIVLPITAIYQLSFFAQSDVFLQVTVFALSLFIFCLSWYRWTLAVYVFIFCIPVFNTLNAIFRIPWPGINVNAVILGALLTSWVYHYIWGNIPFFSMLDNYLCFTRLWQFMQIGVAFYLICSSIRHREQLRNVLWLIVISGVVVGSYGIFQYFAGFRWVGINWFFMRVNATLNGPHAAGIYFATLMVLCVALFFATQSYWRKIMMFAATCVAGGGLWFSGTRTAAFALVIVLGVLALAFLVISMIKSTNVRKVFLIIVAVLLFLGPGYSLIMPTQGPDLLKDLIN